MTKQLFLFCLFFIFLGLYHFNVDDLFQGPVDICIRDYVHIRDYYMKKLSKFYQKNMIYKYYMDYIDPKLKNKKFLWTKMGFETGSMTNLYNILVQIRDQQDDDKPDSIWGQLFDLCIMDEYVCDEKPGKPPKPRKIIKINGDDNWDESSSSSSSNQSIADYVTEQSVANFIALSIKYYCLDLKLKNKGIIIDDDDDDNGNKDYSNKLKDTNFDLKAELTELDKYLLSIVLPYFDIKGIQKRPQSIFDREIINIPLISGIFNRYVNFNEIKDPSTWKMDINAELLKKSLLSNLALNDINVVKNSWKLKKIPIKPQIVDDSAEEKEIVKDQQPQPQPQPQQEKEKVKDEQPPPPQEFEYELVEDKEYIYDLNEINNDNTTLLCYDRTHSYDWAMWFNKALKAYMHDKVSSGFWSILSEFQAIPRIPIKHLEAIRQLLTIHTDRGNHNEKGRNLIITIKDKDYNENDIDKDCKINKWGKYRIKLCNINCGKYTSTTFCIKLLNAWHANWDTPKKKTRTILYMFSIIGEYIQ